MTVLVNILWTEKSSDVLIEAKQRRRHGRSLDIISDVYSGELDRNRRYIYLMMLECPYCNLRC